MLTCLRCGEKRKELKKNIRVCKKCKGRKLRLGVAASSGGSKTYKYSYISAE